MGIKEAGELSAFRKVFTCKFRNHRGRVVDAKGDAIPAEFASVVDAGNGAGEIRRNIISKRVLGLPE